MKSFSSQPRQRQPRFLWQGLLIVLPVAVLAVVSLASLHRDELTAEQTARDRAAQDLQNLAKVIRYAVNDEIRRFANLQANWARELWYSSQPSITSLPDNKLSPDIAGWESDYPGLKFSELATGESTILDDGRQMTPPDIPIVPSPPKWFRELTPEQRRLWESLPKRFAAMAPRDPAFQEFDRSGVSQSARQAAMNLEQRLKYRNFTYGVPLADTEYSESGLSFRSIALQQMLCDAATPISNTLQQAFWSEVIGSSSFNAPLLLELAAKRTNEADAVTCEKFRYTQQLWSTQSKERDWLAPLRGLPELERKWNPPSYWVHWTEGTADEALAFCEPVNLGTNGFDLEGKTYAGKGYKVWFVPRKVIEAIFAHTLSKNRSMIPDFADMSLVVEGRHLSSSKKHAEQSEQSLLGTATEAFGINSGQEAANFELKSFLTNREQMLSSEHQRIKFFSELIVGTALTALIGLLSAWRAFVRQRQLNEMKSNFVSSVSHELRAPIASMRLMAENLETGKIRETPRQKEYFGFIGQECRRLSSLIENILDFSRIEQGRKQYELEPTNVTAVVNETMALMQPVAEEKGVRLELETGNIDLSRQSAAMAEHSTSSIEWNVDGKAMQQALVNLIDNAVKHSPKGSTVHVGLKADNASLQLWVADSGEGIPASEHEKIFERFYRRGSELRRETQGVGIGLSIVKHIVEAHGGQVSVESEVGEGSRFTIEIPEGELNK